MMTETTSIVLAIMAVLILFDMRSSMVGMNHLLLLTSTFSRFVYNTFTKALKGRVNHL